MVLIWCWYGAVRFFDVRVLMFEKIRDLDISTAMRFVAHNERLVVVGVGGRREVLKQAVGITVVVR